MIRKLKIVFDTNVLISILSRRLSFSNLLKSLVNKEYSLCISNEILLEYEEKINLFFDEILVAYIIELFETLPSIHKTEIYYNTNLLLLYTFYYLINI